MKRNPTFLGRPACAAALVLFPVFSVFAQTGGSLNGVVKDPSGAVVPKAKVILTRMSDSRWGSSITTAAGDYSFRNLVPGLYTVSVQAPGFARYEQKGVSVGSATRYDVTLNVGQMSESLTVQGERPGGATTASGATPARIRVGGNLQAPQLVKQARPVYPPELKAAGIQGPVHFRAVLGKEGNLLSLEEVGIEQTDPRLVQAAREAVMQWQYAPTLLNGQPVEVITDIDINFTLAR